MINIRNLEISSFKLISKMKVNTLENNEVNDFIKYFESIRQRTIRVVQCIPEDKIDWSPKEGKMTLGDIVRHFALSERYIFVGIAKYDKNEYPGIDSMKKMSYAETMDFFSKIHQETMDILRTISDEDFKKKVTTPDGAKISVWKWLRAMIEHEVHHRGALYSNLSLLDIITPPIFGLEENQVKSKNIT